MSSENYKYKGISAGAYVEGNIEALSLEEASFKLKEKKIIITNIAREKIKKKLKKKVKNHPFLSVRKKSNHRMLLFSLSNLQQWLKLVYLF